MKVYITEEHVYCPKCKRMMMSNIDITELSPKDWVVYCGNRECIEFRVQYQMPVREHVLKLVPNPQNIFSA